MPDLKRLSLAGRFGGLLLTALMVASCAGAPVSAPPPDGAHVQAARAAVAHWYRTGREPDGWALLDEEAIRALLVGHAFATRTVEGPAIDIAYHLAADGEARSRRPSGGGEAGRWAIRTVDGLPALCMTVMLKGCRMVYSNGEMHALVMYINRGKTLVVELLGERVPG